MTTRVEKQTTLADSVTLNGIGVHSGGPASVTLHPADANTGILFQRSTPDGDVEIVGTWQSVSATALCTVLGDPSHGGVSTVEHLMAAFRGLGVDNAIVEIDGPEMPIMDGSASAFVEAIDATGLVSLNAGRRYIRIKKPVRVVQGDQWSELRPYDGQRFNITIDFDIALIGVQKLDIELTPDAFRNEIARARTFGSVQDVEKLWKLGFQMGSSLENSVALDGDRVLNPEGTRWPDEFVRHKALDAVGDLALAGLPIMGEYRSYKGGHRMNHNVLVELFKNPDAFEIVEASEVAKRSRVSEKGHAELIGGLQAAAFGPEVS
ncbi:UDP-3-O-acyl-N-acetylglucosamine deacetylase [Pseudovibrio exalbescens]|uniref:UDP-3-O-acyl-N-acetylglucosamine deacetylase n=1 Tax=Pseudovibrio exalbescens TaxID=197461 RepID=A0A1U7JLJ2_9HYPH|nr:UDP-3-O-acyl-N-acetylglucosamine deacetylase [Pseudovibrio exalbescens]OKL45616.1 UDP-3-O-[3-hydroxymyristoyl] N-acetylglucosamine deacetylase [Pseudovibrio exalbescens]